MKSSPLLCLCVWASVLDGAWAAGLCGCVLRFCGGFRVAPAPDSQRVWALSAPTHPRRRTPIWAGGAQGEAWISGCTEGRELKGTCCFDSAFDWLRLATDRYALKSFQWCSYTSEKSDPHTQTHTHEQTDSVVRCEWVIARIENQPAWSKHTFISQEANYFCWKTEMEHNMERVHAFQMN